MGKRPRPKPSGRLPGGQSKHPGQARSLIPVEEVAVVIPLMSGHCPRCQQPLPYGPCEAALHGEPAPSLLLGPVDIKKLMLPAA